MRCFSLAVTVFCLAIATGWAQAALHLTAKEHGRTVTMRQGKEFDLALRQNITTGYSWRVISRGEPAVEQLGEPAFVADSALHGAGGVVTFRFRAAAEGRGELKLVYVRPWEKDAKPVDTFTVAIVVGK